MKEGGKVSWLKVEVLEGIKCYWVVRRRVGEGCQHLGYICGGTGSRASSVHCPTVFSALMMDHLPDSVGFLSLQQEWDLVAFTVHDESKHTTSQD